MPDWDADSPELRKNLADVLRSARASAIRRERPVLAMAKRWHRDSMVGLGVPDSRYVGRFRGEAGLETVGVRVGPYRGVPPAQVGTALRTFQARVQRAVQILDEELPAGAPLSEDGLAAIIDLAAWVHAEWVRIHPFANGNGRTARMWANWVFMRYGVPAVVRMRPRPDSGYGRAGTSAMRGDWRPTALVFRRMLNAL